MLERAFLLISAWAIGYFGAVGIALFIIAFRIDKNGTAQSNSLSTFCAGSILSWCVTWFATSIAKFTAKWWWQHNETILCGCSCPKVPIVGVRGIVLHQERLQLESGAKRLAIAFKWKKDRHMKENNVYWLGGPNAAVTYAEFEGFFDFPPDREVKRPAAPADLEVGETYEIFVEFTGMWSIIRPTDPGYVEVQIVSSKPTTTKFTVKALQAVPSHEHDYDIYFKEGVAEVEACQILITSVYKQDFLRFRADVKEVFSRIDKDYDGELNLQNDLSDLAMELIGNAGYRPLLRDDL